MQMSAPEASSGKLNAVGKWSSLELVGGRGKYVLNNNKVLWPQKL